MNGPENKNGKLRLLLLEDEVSDEELILREVRKGGIAHESKCVATKQEFLVALAEFGPEVVLSDYKLAGFTGIDALTIVRAAHPNLPFILVTGALGEELAVETIKRGATDYVLKDRLSTLVPAILRAVRESNERRQRRLAEELVEQQNQQLRLQNEALQKAQRELEVSRERYAHLYDTAPIGYTNLSEEGMICEINSTAAELLGHEPAALIGTTFREYVRPADANKFIEHLSNCARCAGPVRTEMSLVIPGSGYRVVELFSVRASDPDRQTRLCQTAITDITQLTRSGDSFRQSEERFRQLAENIREVFWITDPAKSLMIYISPAYEAVWGRSCQGLYANPKDWIEAVHPDDREKVTEAALTKQIAGQYDEVYRIVRPDDSIRWVHDRAFPIRNDSGEVYRIVGIAEDISEHKRVEESLRESEARKDAILQSALDATITIDHNGRITDSNGAAEKIFGCTSARIIGQEMAEVIIPPPLRGWFRRGLAESFAGNEGPVCGGRIELIGLRADGSEFPIECTITRIQLVGPAMFTAFIRDISGRKRAEEQIRLLANAVQSTQEMISITDDENRFTFVNQAFLDAYGYTESEVLRRKPDFLYSPANPGGLCEEVFQSTLAGGWRGEVLNCRRDGTEFPISLSTSQIKMASGKVLGLVGVARDVSERKRAEKETTTFAELGYRLSAATAPEQAANIILEIASELFGWDAGYVHLCSTDRNKIIPVLTIDTVDGQRTPIPPTAFTHDLSPLMRAIMKDGAQLINRPAESGTRADLVPFGDTNRPSASMMYVPIHSSGTVLGILSIQSYRTQAYSKRDLHLLQTLAAHCGDALRRIEVSEALRETEAKYRSIFQNATEGIFQTTPDGGFLSANPALARMLGYRTPEELIASVADIRQQKYFMPEKWEELKRLIAAKDSVQGFEAELLCRDGVRIWLSINAHTVRDASGTVLFYEGTSQNITARKKAEAVLRESEERFRALFESAPIGIALHDGDGKYIHTNRAYQEMLGYSNEALKGLGVKRVTYSDDVAEGQHLFGELREGTRDFYRREKRYLRKDGSQVWAESSASAVRDQAGRLHYIISMVEDITARKKSEAARRESEALKVAILEAALDCIIVMDHEGRIIEFNPAAERTFGYSRAAILNQPMAEMIVPPAHREHHFQGLKHYMATGKGPVLGKRIEMTAMHANGSEFPVELGIIPILLGKQPIFTAYLRDITDRKQAEEELRLLPQRIIEAQEAERLRVARELHDGVNQLIASVKMRLRRVEDQVAVHSPAAREILERCSQLLGQALAENRRISYDLRPGDLDELGLAVACKHFCQEFQSRTSLKIKSQVPRNWQRLPPTVELNLFRIVQEALSNVEKYAHAKTVWLRLAAKGDAVLLSIRDDGRGFVPEASRAARKRGSGLGLTNMRERASSAGGTCQLVSVPKQGTTITVRLPRAKVK